MSLRFFVDHCVPNFAIKALREAVYEVFQLRDYIAKDSPDSTVISKAQELNSILVSLNGDFADIVSYPPTNYKGIISSSNKKPPRNHTPDYGFIKKLPVNPYRYDSLQG